MYGQNNSRATPATSNSRRNSPGMWWRVHPVMVLDAFRTSSRVALIRMDNGLSAINNVKELTADLGRPHADLYEVALWEDRLTVRGDELFYAYLVDNQAIVIPETIDAIRALTNAERDGAASIAKTNASPAHRSTPRLSTLTSATPQA